jgi:hypothetical protein
MAETVHDVDSMYEHLQKQAEAEQSMLKGAAIFAILCVAVLVVLFLNHISWRKHSMGKVRVPSTHYRNTFSTALPLTAYIIILLLHHFL